MPQKNGMSLLSCPTSIIFVLELTWTQNVKTVPEIKTINYL